MCMSHCYHELGSSKHIKSETFSLKICTAIFIKKIVTVNRAWTMINSTLFWIGRKSNRVYSICLIMDYVIITGSMISKSRSQALQT